MFFPVVLGCAGRVNRIGRADGGVGISAPAALSGWLLAVICSRMAHNGGHLRKSAPASCAVFTVLVKRPPCMALRSPSPSGTGTAVATTGQPPGHANPATFEASYISV